VAERMQSIYQIHREKKELEEDLVFVVAPLNKIRFGTLKRFFTNLGNFFKGNIDHL
jgi:hypothetical protein